MANRKMPEYGVGEAVEEADLPKPVRGRQNLYTELLQQVANKQSGTEFRPIGVFHSASGANNAKNHLKKKFGNFDFQAIKDGMGGSTLYARYKKVPAAPEAAAS